MKKKRVLKVLSVIVISTLLILFFSELLTPTWYGWNNDNTFKGIYKEKKDRIQAVFVGTSQTLNGIAPMELYRQYGICAYNLSSEQQPLLASYYWIKEVERLHAKTLRTVVLDLSFVFQNEDKTPKLSMNEKALAHMRFSRVKLEAYRALSKQYGIKTIEYIIPLIRYHSRWSSATVDDLTGLTTQKNQFFTRGQNLEFEMSHDIKSADKLFVQKNTITEEIDRSQAEINKVLNKRNLGYVQEIADFCKEKGIDLVFMKIAKDSSDVEHDAMQYLADLHGVPLIDFNLPSVKEAAGIDYPYDYWDEKHPNVAGAKKITDYIGAFIVEHSRLDDIRNDPAYDYMKELNAQYQPVADGIDLISGTDLISYLKVLDNDRYTVILSVKGDAATGFFEYAREAFAELGFTNLGAIGERESYLGIKSRGRVLVDENGGKGKRLIADGSFSSKDGVEIEHFYRLSVNEKGEPKNTKPSVEKGENRFSAESGGTKAGNVSSIIVAGKERSDAKRGINIVVYDHELERLIDTSCFDLSSGEPIRTDRSLPYKYYVRLSSAELANAKTIGDYIRSGSQADDCTMVICGTMGWEKPLLTDRDRLVLAEYGIEDGSFIEKQPFVLIIQDDTVLLLNTVDPNEALNAELRGVINVTVKKQPKKDMSVRIGNETYTIGKDCVYVIAYNGRLGSVMNTRYLRKMS